MHMHIYIHTHRHYSMDALIHTQYEDTYDLMLEDMQGPSMQPAPLTNSNPLSCVSHMHASVFMYMLYSGMPCPNMHDWCFFFHHAQVGYTSSYLPPAPPTPPFHQCISVCLHQRSLTQVLTPLSTSSCSEGGLYLLQRPSLLAPRSYILLRVHSSNQIANLGREEPETLM